MDAFLVLVCFIGINALAWNLIKKDKI